MDRTSRITCVSLRQLRPFFALLLVAACAPPPTPAPATVRVDVTDLTAPLLSDLAAAYADVAPDVSLVSNMVPLATVSADLAAGTADLALAGMRDPNLFATPVGYLSFAVVVNPANPVSALSAAQLLEIFAGRVNDWAQAGGPHGVIQVVSREKGSDAEIMFGSRVLAGAPPPLTALAAPTWAAMREAVSQNANAIGYLPEFELDASVKRVAVDADMRMLIVALAVSEPSGAARNFLAWVQSEEGQRVVRQKYEGVR